MIKHLILPVCLAFLVTSAAAEGISVSQSLSSFNIAFEDSVLFGIELRWSGPQSNYLFGRPLNPEIEGMMVRSSSSSISSQGSGPDEVTIKRYRYVLKPIASGAGVVAPVAIEYVTWPDSIPGVLTTEPMTVVIAQPLPPPPKRDWTFLYWLAGGLAIVGAGGTILLLRRSRNQGPTKVVKTEVDRFLDALTVLKADAGSDHKKFQTGLYRILAEFLVRRHGLNVDGRTDSEVSQELRGAGLSEVAAEKITAWFVQAGRDKFSPVAAGPGETIRLEAEIRELFEKL